MVSAVKKGLNFENSVLDMLTGHGLEAWRTNRANPYDPDGYRHGFDGGVDIIARYRHPKKGDVEFTFFIQCKDQKNNLPKTAISEVYTGMHVRQTEESIDGNCIPVVIATCDASKETRRFAGSAGVELFLNAEWNAVLSANDTGNADYGCYGILTRILLHCATDDDTWIDNLQGIECHDAVSPDKPVCSVEYCRHCVSARIKKHGRTKGGVQRYRCNDCGRTFVL